MSYEEATSELKQYLSTRSERKRLFPRAVLVGVSAGLLAVAFRAALELSDASRNRLIEWAHTLPAMGWLVVATFSSLMTLGAYQIVSRFAPETSGSGIPFLEAVLHRHKLMNWSRVLIAKFTGGVLAIGSGMALGREGPTVQMGGATGQGIAKAMSMNPQETLVLIATGAGAGLAAAFNAPLAGLVFVLEELQKDFRPVVFGSAFLAAACADVVGRCFSGQLPVFSAPAYPSPALNTLPLFVLLGLLLGALGVLFNKTLLRMLDFVGNMKSQRKAIYVAAVGAAVGAIAYYHPILAGGGHGLTERVLRGDVVLTIVPIFFLLRFFMSMTSYSTGVAGGIFAPLLALGALVGLGIGESAAHLLPNAHIQPGAFAVVGMAAYFTAIVRAPLTGMVLIIEMTGSYAQMLPLLVTCFCSYMVAELLGDMPIYEALLQRDLLKNSVTLHHEEPIVLELEVQPHSPFDGMYVRDLGLPKGVVLVNLREKGHETVPHADTLLREHMKITAIISPESEGGLQAFRQGCNAPNHGSHSQ